MKFMCVLTFSLGLEERVKNLRRVQVKAKLQLSK